MADTLSVELKTSLSWLLADASDLSTVVDNSRLEFNRNLLDGVGADQADKIWHASGGLASGTEVVWDLGALPQTLFGGSFTVALAKVKLVVVIHRGTVAGEVLVLGGASSQPWAEPFGGAAAGVVEVGPDSLLVLSQKKDGWAVSSGVADQLRLANPASSGVVNWSVVLVGTSS